MFGVSRLWRILPIPREFSVSFLTRSCLLSSRYNDKIDMETKKRLNILLIDQVLELENNWARCNPVSTAGVIKFLSMALLYDASVTDGLQSCKSWIETHLYTSTGSALIDELDSNCSDGGINLNLVAVDFPNIGRYTHHHPHHFCCVHVEKILVVVLT